MSDISKFKNTNSNKVIRKKPQVDSVVFNNTRIKKENYLEKEDIIKLQKKEDEEIIQSNINTEKELDDNKRLFLKVAGIAGLGIAASTILPKSASAYVAGSTPTSNVVGLKDDSNNRINPATEETLTELISGQSVNKKTVNLSSSGNLLTPASGKKIRVYASRFSLTANANSVSFRFTSGGSDYEKYLSPKTGGLYGANNHPNYIEGGVDEVLYCVIDGTTTIQINIDYLEV